MKNKITIANTLFFEQALGFLQQGKRVTIAVKGKSMWPFLNDGEKVLLKPFAAADLKLGMVLLANVKGQVVLHRVVKYNTAEIWLAGDHNLVAHERASYEEVLASMVCVKRGRRQLGMLWYWARPLRRMLTKLFMVSF